MSNATEAFARGRCGCGAVQYALLREPMFVHCCHCTWCQRETGSAFAVNALIEAHAVVLEQGAPRVILTPSLSGSGQHITRCPDCHCAVWSNYGAAREKVHFIRVGTLDEPSLCPPDVHIYTASKQPWVELNDGAVICEAYYSRSKLWPQASIDRYQAARSG